MNNISDNLKEVGFMESYSSGQREIYPFYINTESNKLEFYCSLESGDIILYPSACRINDFSFTWSGCHYRYDEETERHYYINPFYDGETFYLYADSVAELLELVRQFVEPTDSIIEILEDSPEAQKHFKEIREIYNREKD